jgi:aerotaxis receptor
MNDMDSNPVATSPVELQLRYFNGTQRNALITDVEVPYPDGKLIVSRTDTAGVITQCNQAFIEMSGYAAAEIIGQPHCLLRHPDMPRAAYADLWSTVSSGKKWHGYVKNLRKDGAYYWVHAVVVPNVREGIIVGYTSVRRKPSRSKVSEALALYAEMTAKESA